MRYILLIVLIFNFAYSDDDYYYGNNKKGVKPVENKLYINECSACHFAYQPGLLTQKSWVKLMNNLQNHFGVDASLLKEDLATLTTYLKNNSAEKNMNYKRSRKLANSINRLNAYPIAITKVPYFIKEHDEIPSRFIKQKEVKGLFNCTACHTTAKKGIYSERDIIIPNYGRWDD
ncbi:MAG: diheme cytochrome c [Campylobacterota bacterium]